MLVAVSAKVVISSWLEKRTNIGSCVEESRIVASVPSITKCLSGVETKEKVLVVGAALTSTARFPAKPSLVSHLNIGPSTSWQSKSSPKLSNCHTLDSRLTPVVPAVLGTPHSSSPQAPVPHPKS